MESEVLFLIENQSNMIQPNIRFCQLCEEPIPSYRNGNSKFCSDKCYSENKALEAEAAYKKRALDHILLSNDDKVHEIYILYRGNEIISAKLLIDLNFNWDVYTGEITIQNLKAKKLIRYGYTLFTNQTVQIWKL